MMHYVQGAIEENNKTKKPEQLSFEMNEVDYYKRDIQMDGVFEKYENRRSFVEKIYCPNKYPVEAGYYTKCMLKITDTNEDFDLIFNINDNPLPEKYVTEMNFYDVWDRHSCKVFSSIAADSNRGYIGNSQVDLNPIKYFKINSTDDI